MIATFVVLSPSQYTNYYENNAKESHRHCGFIVLVSEFSEFAVDDQLF